MKSSQSNISETFLRTEKALMKHQDFVFRQLKKHARSEIRKFTKTMSEIINDKFDEFDNRIKLSKK